MFVAIVALECGCVWGEGSGEGVQTTGGGGERDRTREGARGRGIGKGEGVGNGRARGREGGERPTDRGACTESKVTRPDIDSLSADPRSNRTRDRLSGRNGTRTTRQDRGCGHGIRREGSGGGGDAVRDRERAGGDTTPDVDCDGKGLRHPGQG